MREEGRRDLDQLVKDVQSSWSIDRSIRQKPLSTDTRGAQVAVRWPAMDVATPKVRPFLAFIALNSVDDYHFGAHGAHAFVTTECTFEGAILLNRFLFRKTCTQEVDWPSTRVTVGYCCRLILTTNHTIFRARFCRDQSIFPILFQKASLKLAKVTRKLTNLRLTFSDQPRVVDRDLLF